MIVSLYLIYAFIVTRYSYLLLFLLVTWIPDVVLIIVIADLIDTKMNNGVIQNDK